MLGTAMGGGGGGMNPPGTGMRGMMGTRQGLGSRQGTRQGTAAQQPVLGVGALTDVKIAERPTTMQGMMGMKTGSVGPKRQIYDRSYYMGELRKRCTQLQDELTKINNELNQVSQDNQLYANLDKRYESLVKTVRALEGDLADHNLATDKLRTDTQPEEVHHMFMIMKQQNEQQRNDVDQIFLEKRSHEEEIQKMEAESRSIQRAAEARLNELHPDQRLEYEDYKEEKSKLETELQSGREDLEQASSRLLSLESRLQMDGLRARSQVVMMNYKEVSERLMELEQEVRQCSMSVPEQRELLLSKVKTDNTEIVATEKRNSEMKLEKERLKQQIKDVASDAQEKKDEGGDQQKYEILFAKDQEMSQFIASFDSHKAEEDQKLKEKQETIIRLLENISTNINTPSEVTPENHMRDLEDELEFKEKQLKNSETTQNRLEGELNKRQGELEKIESLDVKISQELQQVETKMRQYEQDIEQKYDRVGELQAECQRNAKELELRKQQLEGRASSLRQQVGFLRLRHESRRQQLADDESAIALEAQENKIKQFGQTLFTLRSFIKQKCGESDFAAELGICLNAAAEINKILQERRPGPMA
jgi:intraflagellar transport protein 74